MDTTAIEKIHSLVRAVPAAAGHPACLVFP
jgi:hypothetical protein